MLYPTKISCHTRCSNRGIEETSKGGDGGKSCLPNAAPSRDDALGSIQLNLFRRWSLHCDMSNARLLMPLANLRYQSCHPERSKGSLSIHRRAAHSRDKRRQRSPTV